jgi:hypothetical protein
VSGKSSGMPETENDFPNHRMDCDPDDSRRSDLLNQTRPRATRITDICHQVKRRRSGNFFEVYAGSN